MHEKPLPEIRLVPLFGMTKKGQTISPGFLKKLYPRKKEYHPLIAGPESRWSILRDALRGRKWFGIENAKHDVVGAVSIVVHEGEGWIGRLFILPAYRHQRYGESAVKAVEGHVVARGITNFHAFVADINLVSEKTFRKAGFEPNDRLSRLNEGGKIFTHRLRV